MSEATVARHYLLNRKVPPDAVISQPQGRSTQASMTAVAARIAGHKALGKQIALVGVAAKALTFIRAAGIAPDLYLDEAPLKVGRLVPGAGTPIGPLSSIPELTRDTVFLIGAWNFAEELIGKIKSCKRGFGSTFLIHFPQLREIG